MRTTLREGFTTGTAAAAAAAAAVALLLGGDPPVAVRVALPPFPSDRFLDIPVERCAPAPSTALEDGLSTGELGPFLPPENAPLVRASVIKDGGDDPDATHGARLTVHACLLPFSAAASRGAASLPVPATLPGRNPVFLYAGRGIGRVTLPGLPVPPGAPAINPGPRAQIALAASGAAAALGYTGPLHLLVAAPDGEELARRTLNARLGIMGGISILGTRGTVKPFSHEAWQKAIAQGVAVAGALNLDTLLLSTGRRSEKALFSLYPHLPPAAGVQAADFAAFSVRLAATGPFTRIAWGCFPGKLLKLAQGMEYTHARTGPADISLLAALWRDAGGDPDTARRIAAMPTASGALAFMAGQDVPLRDAVLETLARRAHARLCSWMAAPESRGGKPELALHVFAMEGDPLLTLTSRAPRPEPDAGSGASGKDRPPLFLAGLGLPGSAALPPDHPCLQAADLLVGGERRLAAYAGLGADTLALGADLDPVLRAVRSARAAGKRVAVLCGGDPLYFGLGSRLLRQEDGPPPLILPGISSLQAAAALIGLSWESVRSVSLHGRSDWLPLAHALISGDPVFLLTDPSIILRDVAAYLLERGRAGYRMHVIAGMSAAPDTGLPRAGSLRVLLPEEAVREEEVHREPRVVLLEPLATEGDPALAPSLGLPDRDLVRERGLLTKQPVRAAALAALGVAPRHTVWDLGAGSGAVGIEASRLAWQGFAVAVERDPSRIGHIRENRRRFGAANLEIVHGDLPEALEGLSGPDPDPALSRARPHAVFLGGGLGEARNAAARTRRTLAAAWELLLPGGRLTASCALLGSLETARRFLARAGAELSLSCVQTSLSEPLAGDLRLTAANPVFLLTAVKPVTPGRDSGNDASGPTGDPA